VSTLEKLREAVGEQPWLWEAVERIAAEPDAIGRLFPAVGRRVGRAPLPDAPGWTADEAARTLLLAALPAERAAVEVHALYRYGDAAEKRAVLKALPLLPVGDAAAPLLHDAIRTNDTRLLAAALGPYAKHLEAPAWRQAVLKCVFTGVSLSTVDRLDERADAELAAMLTGYAQERRAAGREVPADALALLDHLKGA
jgi:hypothetical protein